MKVEWEIPDDVAKVLAEALATAEHPQRNVRCDPGNRDNIPYYVINGLGAALMARINGGEA